MRKPYLFAFFIAIALLFSAVPNASAHRPGEGIEGAITRIPDAVTSFAFYRSFDAESFVHAYSVEGEAGQDFHAGIQIPQIAGLQSYAVTLGLFGPGLPPLDSAVLGLPDELSSNRPSIPALPQPAGRTSLLNPLSGGGLIVNSEVTPDFFEPFTQTRYWGRQSLDITLPERGTYYLLVWQPDEIPGKYVLDTGRQEVFSAGDLLRFPGWWWDVRAYFGQLPSTAGLSLGLITLLAAVVVLRKRVEKP